MVGVTRFTFAENYQKRYYCKKKSFTLRISHYNYFTRGSPELVVRHFQTFILCLQFSSPSISLYYNYFITVITRNKINCITHSCLVDICKLNITP
jgi:hypothetical protein